MAQTLCFSPDDLAWFAKASHDVNPLHVSATYARKTPFGQPVVFGVLGALAALGAVSERPDRRLATLRCDFDAPLFTGLPYEVHVEADSPDHAVVAIRDGSRTMLRLEAHYQPERQPESSPATTDQPSATTPAAPDPTDWTAISASGTYRPGTTAVADANAKWSLSACGITDAQVAALLWASYLIGMELPGRRALFQRLDLTFPTHPAIDPAGLAYTATISRYDRRFALLRLAATLGDPSAPVAMGTLAALVRPELPPLNPVVLDERLPPSDALAGQVAFVSGASRGLGAHLAYFLAQQGCTVLANYHRSHADAEALRESVRSTTGRIVLMPGDIADPDWCRQQAGTIRSEFGRLDILICNASPPLQALKIEPASGQRILSFVQDSLAQAVSPLCAFLDLLAAGRGRNVLISSSAAVRPPARWAHYVSAKAALEGLFRAVTVDCSLLATLIVRPERLATDFVSALGPQQPLDPAIVAARIVEHLVAPATPGNVTELATFT